MAKKYGWTIADTDRAYKAANITFVQNTPSEQELLLALVQFAGPELKARQSAQAAQRGLATKRHNYIQELKISYSQDVKKLEQKIDKQKSLFVNAIDWLYKRFRAFGLRDQWIETLLETYNHYLSDDWSTDQEGEQDELDSENG